MCCSLSSMQMSSAGRNLRSTRQSAGVSRDSYLLGLQSCRCCPSLLCCGNMNIHYVLRGCLLMPQSAKCCHPLQIIVLLVLDGDQQPALTDAKGLRCYHSLEVVNCGATLGGRAFLGGANGNIYEVVMQAKTVELVRSCVAVGSLDGHVISDMLSAKR